MAGFVAYDPLRLSLLRTRIVDAIVHLRSIRSDDSEAAAALAAVARAGALLELDHLAAVEEALASEAMVRHGFGIRLRGVRAPRPADRAVTRRHLAVTDLDDLTDEQLAEALFRLVDPAPPAMWQINELHDVQQLDSIAAEVLARIHAGDIGLAALVAGRLDRERLPRALDAISHLVAERRRDPLYDDEDIDAGAGTAVFGQILLGVARWTPDVRAWLFEAAESSHTIARILLSDTESLDDSQIHTLTAGILRGDVDWAADHPLADSGNVALDAVRDDADLSAQLLADPDVLEVLLTNGDLDADLVRDVVAIGLNRPTLQRAGTRKSAVQADDELLDGLAVWQHAVAADRRYVLSAGAMRGLAGSLLVYLPSIAGAVHPLERGSGDSEDEQPVETMLADGSVAPLGNYGDLAALLGAMTTDPQAAAALDESVNAFTTVLVRQGFSNVAGRRRASIAERRTTIGRTTTPALRLARLIDHGIGNEEADRRAAHAASERWKTLGVDLGFESLQLLLLKKPARLPGTSWELSEAPAEGVLADRLQALVSSPAPTLSRRIPLDFGTEYRAILFDELLRTDLEQRRDLGLGAVSYDEWARLLLAVGCFEVDREAGNEGIRQLVGDQNVDPTAAALRDFHRDVFEAAPDPAASGVACSEACNSG